MTTTNLNQDVLDAAVAAAEAARADVVARANAIRQEAERIVTQQGNERRAFEIAAAVNDRRHQDNLAVVGEEIGQLRDIVPEVFGAPVAQQPAAPVQPQNPYVAGNGNGGNADGTQAMQPVPPPAPARRGFGETVVPRNGRHWLFAIIGAILGLLLGYFLSPVLWTDALFNDIQTHASAHDRLIALWEFGFALMGFGLGGVAYWWDVDRHRRQH